MNHQSHFNIQQENIIPGNTEKEHVLSVSIWEPIPVYSLKNKSKINQQNSYLYEYNFHWIKN